MGDRGATTFRSVLREVLVDELANPASPLRQVVCDVVREEVTLIGVEMQHKRDAVTRGRDVGDLLVESAGARTRPAGDVRALA